MAKLRKTLPGDFREIVAAGDVEKIKSALRKCLPDAYDDNYSRKSALMNTDLPEEVIRKVFPSLIILNTLECYTNCSLFSKEK